MGVGLKGMNRKEKASNWGPSNVRVEGAVRFAAEWSGRCCRELQRGTRGMLGASSLLRTLAGEASPTIHARGGNRVW